VNRARLLRKKATEAERILWRHLRNRNFAGYKFRRQHPLDCYILDFYCPAAKLAIELDGGGHSYRTGQIRDRRRSKLLACRGITVLRFWNHQVRQEIDSRLNLFYAIHVRSLSANQTLDRRGPGFHIMPMVDGKPAAYVCEHFTCKAPVTDPKQLAKLLKL
jgi:very-short-patch-repair endonuclease